MDKKSTSDFTEQIDNLVERTKLNEIFRGDYMAWGLAEFDAEQRGKKEGYSAGLSDGISQGEQQKAIETAKNMLSASLGTLEQIAQITNLPLETVKDLAEK